MQNRNQIRLSKVRSNLLLHQPFFGVLSLKLEIREDNSIPVMAVSKDTLYYNSSFVEQTSDIDLKFIFCHELMHIALLHLVRMRKNKYPNREKVNIAQDYAINQILIDENFLPPIDAKPLYDKKYKGMSAEKIYNLIPDEEVEKLFPKTLTAMVIIDEHATADDIVREELKTKTLLQSATEAGIKAGKIPGIIKELVAAMLKPKVNWKAALHAYFRNKIRTGITWSRPNRIFISQDIYLPSVKKEKAINIVLVIDTSGSISKKLLKVFTSEINYLLASVKLKRLSIIQCDTKIHNITDYVKEDLPVTLEIIGRGGTEFTPVFDAIDTGEIEEPSLLIYLTDLYATFPDKAPTNYDVLWIAVNSTVSSVPFGSLISLDD